MTESKLSIILDENSDFQLVLEKYLKKLDANEPPSYRVTKFLLKKLNSPNNADLITILDRSVNEDRRHQLINLILKHKKLAEKNKRNDIENKRREEAKTHSDWLAYNKTSVDQNERDTTELIGAVEFIYFLNCRKDQIKELNKLSTNEVFGLSKLIGAFTKDYKILNLFMHLYEDDKTKQQEIVKQAIKEIEKFFFEPTRFTKEEFKSFSDVILNNADSATFKSNIDYGFSRFDSEEFDIVGNTSNLSSSLVISGLVCENLESLQKRLKTDSDIISKFWSNLNGTPYILAKIEWAFARPNKLLANVNPKTNDSNDILIENAIRVVSLLLPILRFAIETDKLKTFDQSSQKAQAQRILSDYPKITKEFIQQDKTSFMLLKKYLEKI